MRRYQQLATRRSTFTRIGSLPKYGVIKVTAPRLRPIDEPGPNHGSPAQLEVT